MSDILKKQQLNFTMIPNTLICDPTISSKAKAVYCYLYSRPDDWQFYTKEIEKNFKEGRDAINSAISELISFGWIEKEQVRISGRFSHNEFTINIEQKAVNGITVNGKAVNGKTVNGKSAPTNTNRTNTEITNTEEILSSEIVVVDDIPYSEIIDHLNYTTQSSFKASSDKTRSLIRARWAEGFRLNDFMYVHSVKNAEWGKDDAMAKFLRPETLYSNKFEAYRNQKQTKRQQGEQLAQAMLAGGVGNIFDLIGRSA